jgi:hypothetical protein
MNLALLVSVRPNISYRSPLMRIPPGLWRVKFAGDYHSVMVWEELGSPLAGKLENNLEIVGGKSFSIGFIHVSSDDKEISVSVERVNELKSPGDAG